MTDYDWEMQERKFENDMAMIDLEAENAQLREENERFIIKLNAEHIVRQNVESENTKLRELVADMFGWYIKSECSNCEYRLDCHKLDRACDYMREFVPSMVELGIEVDE